MISTAIFCAAIIILLAVVWLLLEVIKYTRMIGKIFMGLVYQAEPVNLSSEKLISTKPFLIDSDNIEAIYTPIEKPKAIVIFCHESGSNKESWMKYAFFLPENGYLVVSFDFDAKKSDKQDNQFSQWPIREYIEKLHRVVKGAKHHYPDLPIVLFGVSNGADIALQAAATDKSVALLVTDGLYSIKEIFRQYIHRWAPVIVKPNLFGQQYPSWVVEIFACLGFWRCQKVANTQFADVEDLLKRYDRPLLMIHGQEDHYVDKHHQITLQKIRGHRYPTLDWQVSRAGHNQSVLIEKNNYQNKILGFIHEHL